VLSLWGSPSEAPYYAIKSKDGECSAYEHRRNSDQQGSNHDPEGNPRRPAHEAGDRMTFILLPNGTVLMRVKNKSAMDVAGRLHKKGRKALPVEDLSR
jgi:hypothetical protein